MQSAEQAVADLQASRAQSLDDQIRQAAFHVIHNSGPINKILVDGTIEKTSFRILDENKARMAIEQAASSLAQQTVQVNVSTQNRLKAHIDHLNAQNVQLQETNISLQSTLLAEQEKYHKLLEAKLEELNKADIEEELEKLDSFTYDVLNRQMFPTPKKPAPPPRDGTVVGGGNLFGTEEELQHNKLKY